MDRGGANLPPAESICRTTGYCHETKEFLFSENTKRISRTSSAQGSALQARPVARRETQADAVDHIP